MQYIGSHNCCGLLLLRRVNYKGGKSEEVETLSVFHYKNELVVHEIQKFGTLDLGKYKF